MRDGETMSKNRLSQSPLARYIRTMRRIREERGGRCECCDAPANHGHHVVPVSATSVHAALVYEPANIMLLCDDCHALMHPLIRNIAEWKIARRDRGQALVRR